MIWATGYRADDGWIHVPRDAEGRIPHRRGVADAPGLYLLGLSWQHTRGSALIGVGRRRRRVHRGEDHGPSFRA